MNSATREYGSAGLARVEGSEVPTHWMPGPGDPIETEAGKDGTK